MPAIIEPQVGNLEGRHLRALTPALGSPSQVHQYCSLSSKGVASGRHAPTGKCHGTCLKVAPQSLTVLRLSPQPPNTWKPVIGPRQCELPDTLACGECVDVRRKSRLCRCPCGESSVVHTDVDQSEASMCSAGQAGRQPAAAATRDSSPTWACIEKHQSSTKHSSLLPFASPRPHQRLSFSLSASGLCDVSPYPNPTI